MATLSVYSGTCMDPLDLTQEEAQVFFHCKKTEMSCIEQPRTFLNQLRDYNLVPEDIYKKVFRMKSKQQRERGVYQLLDWLETERPQCIKLFWSCMFKDHILQLYPVLRLLRNSLLDGSFDFSENLPEKEKTSEECMIGEQKKKVEEKQSEKKKGKKGKKSVEEDEEPDLSTQSTPRKKKRPQKPTYNSPIRKGVKEDIWNWPFYKTQVPVTCGDKKGSLHRHKLARGERCILAVGRWFSPHEFEDFGGRKSSKNWKTSIRCQNTPLRKLIQKGHLTPPPCSKPQQSSTSLNKQRRRLIPSRAADTISVSVTDSEEEEEEEEDEEEENEGTCENETDDNGDMEDQSDVDMTGFHGACLSVTRGSAIGTLQRDRFASGTSGKCIRTANKWMTPAEFVQEGPAHVDSWRKSILCQGIPLSDLIKRKVLTLHSLLCKCRLCSKQEADLQEQENDDHCAVCHKLGSLVCCDQCPRAFHSSCHLPTVDMSIVGEKWLCTYCVLTESHQWRYACNRSLTQALDSCISDFMLECQYLLLKLYSSDEQHVFAPNPCASVPLYSNFIKNPMWLDKVAEKLENRHYLSVGQFVSDVHLIFDNCVIFNKDNEFGQMGTRLKELFEREFQCVFSVLQ